MTDDYPPPDDARERATDRRRDRIERTDRAKHANRADRAERVLEEFVAWIEDRSYPVSGEELAAAYADRPTNGTDGSVGAAVDRLDGEYDSLAEVREALYDELTGRAAGGEADDAGRSVEGSGDGVD